MSEQVSETPTEQEDSSEVAPQGGSNFKNYFGLAVNVFSTFIVSISVGMNAIIFPVTMESQGLSNTLIGTILSLEVAASLIVCLSIVRILSFVHFNLGFLITTIIRVGALLALVFWQDVTSWIFFVFLHGIGVFGFLILMQTWANAIPFKKFKGLMVALYSTSISLGVAAGPVVLRFVPEFAPTLESLSVSLLGMPIENPELQTQFLASAFLSTVAIVPVVLFMNMVPKFEFAKGTSLIRIIKKSPAVMFAVAMAAVSYYGVSSFITLYGITNNLSVETAALLLTFFMLGSLALETPISFLSDFLDRRYVIMVAVLISIVCAVTLPITIYRPYQAYALLFVWGGIIGAIYSVALTVLGERHEGEELVAANAAYSLMEGVGGTFGVMFIGFAMDVFDSDGLPYIIMFAGIAYFSFALTRYKVR